MACFSFARVKFANDSLASHDYLFASSMRYLPLLHFDSTHHPSVMRTPAWYSNMESEELEPNVIESCIKLCNAVQRISKEWEEDRNDDHCKDLILFYSNQASPLVQELQELKPIHELISVLQKAQIRRLEKRVKQQEGDLEFQVGEASSQIEELEKRVEQQGEDLELKTALGSLLSESLKT